MMSLDRGDDDDGGGDEALLLICPLRSVLLSHRLRDYWMAYHSLFLCGMSVGVGRSTLVRYCPIGIRCLFGTILQNIQDCCCMYFLKDPDLTEKNYDLVVYYDPEMRDHHCLETDWEHYLKWPESNVL